MDYGSYTPEVDVHSAPHDEYNSENPACIFTQRLFLEFGILPKEEEEKGITVLVS